ncbi:MAG TPA: tetratricopeptide repeat protein, partial [Allocoleopsis sp.]
INDYNQTITLNPNFAEAYYNRGLIHKKQGDTQKAIADFKKAATLYQQQKKNDYYKDALQQINQLQAN